MTLVQLQFYSTMLEWRQWVMYWRLHLRRLRRQLQSTWRLTFGRFKHFFQEWLMRLRDTLWQLRRLQVTVHWGEMRRTLLRNMPFEDMWRVCRVNWDITLYIRILSLLLCSHILFIQIWQKGSKWRRSNYIYEFEGIRREILNVSC